MCEWLCGAAAGAAAGAVAGAAGVAGWCDVSLVCGGRAIGAHRAVLASVSAFMKKILISCHDNDSPTLIVLPDFELDSMMSVLFYIYNGEVVVPRSRFESFLDIIIALKIYVDKQFLDNIQKNLPGIDKKLEIIEAISKEVSECLHVSQDAMKLESDMDNRHFITIKRNEQKQEVADVLKIIEPYKNQSQKQYYSESLQSQHRQKKSLRRGLFIETYPRNGNSNGLASGVPAIPNEVNLDSTSELLMNANDYSRSVDALTATAVDAATVTCIVTASKGRNLVENIDDMTQLRPKPYLRDKLLDATSMIPEIPDLKYRVVEMNSPLPQCSKSNNKELMSQMDVKRCSVKATIFNRVMQSPWCPQLPISYRPFRRKHLNKKPDAISNDNNNNIESSVELSTRVNELRNMENGEKSEITEQLLAETVTESTELKCYICGQVYPDSDLLATHTKCHASTARFTCSDCGKTFSQLRNYKYHMSVHRGTREFAATCPVCGKYFNDRGYLSSHMKIHRNRKEYKCQLCPKSFNQRVAYNMHVRIHTGVKPHVCEQCGKAFSRKMLLKQHQRTHSGERPYACPHCEKRFADRSNMTLHLRLHTGVKPFSCTLCPKSFTKKHHLKSHLNFHTGAKPYSCPRCHLGFTQSSNMRTHMKKCGV